MKRFPLLAAACSLLCFSVPAVLFAEPPAKTIYTARELNLRSTLKNLFVQCLTRQRVYNVKVVTGSEDRGAAKLKLDETLGKLGGVFKTNLGDDAGERLSALLKQQVLLTAEYADTVKNKGDKTLVNAKMRAKADQIAAQLNTLSPVWAKSGIASLLKKYSALSFQEIDGQSVTLAAVDAKLMSETFNTSMEIADAFATGIVQQFPAQFKQELPAVPGN